MVKFSLTSIWLDTYVRVVSFFDSSFGWVSSLCSVVPLLTSMVALESLQQNGSQYGKMNNVLPPSVDIDFRTNRLNYYQTIRRIRTSYVYGTIKQWFYCLSGWYLKVDRYVHRPKKDENQTGRTPVQSSVENKNVGQDVQWPVFYQICKVQVCFICLLITMLVQVFLQLQTHAYNYICIIIPFNSHFSTKVTKWQV